MSKLIALAALLAAACIAAAPALADDPPQCLGKRLTMTWGDCPEAAPQAAPAPVKPKARVQRPAREYHAPVPEYPQPAVYAPPAPAVPVGNCPTGYVQFAHVWSLHSLAPHLQAQAQALIAVARARDSHDARALPPYRPDAVSRTLGAQMRTGPWGPAPINDGVQIRYLDPRDGRLVREVGVIRLNHGVGSILLPGDPRQYVVEAIWPQHLISPTPSGGVLRTRSFPNEPRGCRDHIHGLTP